MDGLGLCLSRQKCVYVILQTSNQHRGLDKKEKEMIERAIPPDIKKIQIQNSNFTRDRLAFEPQYCILFKK